MTEQKDILVQLREHLDLMEDLQFDEPEITSLFLRAIGAIRTLREDGSTLRAEAVTQQVEIDRLTRELACAKAYQLVPGVMRCAKCQFELNRINLYVNSGTTGPGNNKTEPCPNGCGPLWPITWEQDARQGWEVAERLQERILLLEKDSKLATDEPVAWRYCDLTEDGQKWRLTTLPALAEARNQHHGMVVEPLYLRPSSAFAMQHLESDVKRLEWMITCGCQICHDLEESGYYVFWHTSNRVGPLKPTAREAVDAAMAKEVNG